MKVHLFLLLVQVFARGEKEDVTNLKSPSFETKTLSNNDL